MTAALMHCCSRIRGLVGLHSTGGARPLLASFVWQMWSALLVALFLAGTAQAHKASDAYLQFKPAAGGLQMRFDIALRDLDAVLPIDSNDDQVLQWGEVRRAYPALDEYAMLHLQWPDGCNPKIVEHALERRSDGAYVALFINAACLLTRDFALGYTLFADVDPTHRGIATIDMGDGAPTVRLLDPAQPAAVGHSGAHTAVQKSASATALPSFIAAGLHHIVTGYDHVLFLLCLLLPAVVRRVNGRWMAVVRARDAAVPVLGVVTLFTVAHSITLALAALDVVSLSPGFIEPAIAATIMVAAADNLRPVFGRMRYAITFGFGLIHGFGFAGALKEVSLPTAEFAWALLKFNMGIEAGQLAIVALVVPLLFAARNWRGYPRWVLRAGSVVALLLATVWLIERVADVSLLPFSV